MNKRLWRAGLLCTIFAATPVALAADLNEGGFWYAGGAIGEATIDDIGLSDIDDGSVLTSGNVDDSDTAWSIYGGYQFNEYFGLEGSYVNFGEMKISAMSDGTGITYDAGPVVYTAEATGFTVEGLASFPFTNSFSGFAKVGALFWEADLVARFTELGSPVAMKTTEDDTDLTYGIGFAYQFQAPFSLRVEWQRYELDDVDADLIAIAGTFQFGKQ